MSDLIERQKAIDAECEVCQIAPKKERGHNCIYYVHGCKEIECLRVLPSAEPEIEERTEEFAQNVPKEDLISRKAAIDILDAYQVMVENGEEKPYAWARLRMSELPSAQPELSDAVYQLWKRAYEAGERSAQSEVIKCEDCKHRGEKPVADGRYWCNIHNAFMYYCSDAERRTDDANDIT